MDHIPSQGPHVIRVPYPEGEAWDCGDFASYGERRGLSKVSGDMSPTEQLQILQAWLFFGLIERIMGLVGIAYNADNFISSDERGRRINTKDLPTLIVNLVDYERGQETGRTERCQRITSLLQTVVKVTDSYWSHGDENADTVDKAFVRDTGGPVLLAICIATRAMTETCTNLYKGEFDSSACEMQNGVGLVFLKNTMQAEGWCPSFVTRLGRLGSREFLYLGYTHGPWHLRGSDHSHCTNFCAYDRIDTSTYEPRHEREGCACAMIESNREQMESIIDAGGIPVCRLLTIPQAEGEGSDMILQIEPASDQRPYIALSHVWAHGLGNPRQNALPRCTADRIKRSIASSWHGMSKQGVQRMQDEYGFVDGFWMDTFCVPVHPSSKHLRRKAIAQMKDIYEGAVAVYVLDRVLQQRPSQNLAEMLIAVSLSPWARRLWTFQEAALAERIHVLFQSGVLVDFDLLVADAMRSLTSRAMLSIWKSLRPYTPHSKIRMTIETPAGQALSSSKTGMNSANVADILSQLPYRATTRRSDETICISTILGMDVMPLLEVEAANEDDLCGQRMMRLLSHLSILPASLAFSAGPKMTTPGFRWAPKTFLQDESGKLSTSVSGWHAKVVQSKGLVCKMDAMVFSQEYSKEELANVDQFMLFETGNISQGPIVVSTPPGQDYHQQEQRVTPPGHDSSEALFVLLFNRSFDHRIASLGMMCVVREKAAIEVLKSEMAKGVISHDSNQGHIEARLDSRETHEFGHSGSNIVIGSASYKKTGREPAEVWNAEDGEFSVECVKVMMGWRTSDQREDIKTRLPAALLQGRTWTLT